MKKGFFVGLGLMVSVLLVFLATRQVSKHLPRPPAPPDLGALSPGVHTERRVVTMPPPPTRSTPAATPTPPEPEKPHGFFSVEKRHGAMYQETVDVPSPSPTPVSEPERASEEEPLAPYGMLIRCSTINALVSGEKTPVIAKVEEPLVWHGKLVVGRCSIAHGTGQLGYSKSSINADGTWTIVLYDERHPDQSPELVVNAMALDEEYDPNFKSHGVLNGSPGIHGNLITVDAWADVKVFAASALSAASGSIQGTATNFFGGSTPNVNARGAGGISGSVLNPLAQGTQAVLNGYAQTIVDAIHRDGVYVLVPPGKTFLLYVTQDIYAPRGGDAERTKVKRRYLRERSVDEDVTEPRETRDARKDAASQNPLGTLGTLSQAPPTPQATEDAQRGFQERTRAFQEQLSALKTAPASNNGNVVTKP